jgi:hypothetical protein
MWLPESMFDYEEDFQPLIDTVQWSINLKRNGFSNPSWQSLYRAYRSELHDLSKTDLEIAETALSFLRILSLEQTLPFNEADSPDFVDSYTGEFTPHVDILDLDAEWYDDFDEPAPAKPIDRVRISITDAYPDKKMRLAAQRASAERLYPMEYDHELHLEDRGFEPEGFKPDIGPDTELSAAANLVQGAADDLRARIDLEIETEKGAFGDEFKYRIPFVRAKIQHSDEADAYLAELQSLIDQEHNLANVAMLFMRFQHAFGFDPKHAEQLQVRTGEGFVHLRNFINENWDQLETYDGVSMTPELTEHQLAKIADKMLHQTVEPFGEYRPNQAGAMIRSTAFCEGYILAVQAGSIPKDAYNAGFNAWRQWYSADANEAYHKVFSSIAWPRPSEELYDTHEAYEDDIKEWLKDNVTAMKKAMATFWTECRKRGLDTPNRPPKQVKSIAPRGTGLILENGRFITWRTAVMIVNAEGFDLTPERKDKLVELLTKNRWSPQFVQALSS